MKLYIMRLGTREYVTTSDAVAWDLGLRFGAELIGTEQTDSETANFIILIPCKGFQDARVRCGAHTTRDGNATVYQAERSQ